MLFDFVPFVLWNGTFEEHLYINAIGHITTTVLPTSARAHEPGASVPVPDGWETLECLRVTDGVNDGMATSTKPLNSSQVGYWMEITHGTKLLLHHKELHCCDATQWNVMRTATAWCRNGSDMKISRSYTASMMQVAQLRIYLLTFHTFVVFNKNHLLA